MRNPFRSERLAAVAATFVASLAGSAAAQSAGPDVAVVTPNVMLLVDTSGSMELKADSSSPPVCVPDTPNTGSAADQNEKSRWTDLIEVLSGTISNYSCYSESRSSPEFLQEYGLGPSFLPPRDYLTSSNANATTATFNYHRPMSNKCAPGPGDLPALATPWDWPAAPESAIKYRPYNGSTISNISTCPAWTSSNQADDGLLDSFNGLLRFGLMTFDTEADAGTGVSGANLTYGVVDGNSDYRNGIRGSWSYFLSTGAGCRQKAPVSTAVQCQSSYPDGTTQANDPGCCMGGPINCTTLSPWEVGARNAAAPPWEGRMVAFGPSAEDGTKRNAWIQDVIRATRPFGATPIAGMLNDARDFFWNDGTQDPLNQATGDFFGPSKDPQVVNSCRQDYIVLLTDGEPNSDLRAPCEGVSSDKCPYDRAEDITKDLANPAGTNKKVRTFVVGFALDKVTVGGTTIDCKTLSPTDSACANPTDPALKVCCSLNNIAFNGTPLAEQSDPNAIKYALFPQTPADLRTALSAVFTAATGKATATRTYPVTVLAAQADLTQTAPKLAGYEITSGYHPGDWKGELIRTRISCDASQQIHFEDVADNKGDDFGANVNSAPTQRTMFTVEAPSGAATWNPTFSVRPYFIDPLLDDGIHFGSGAQSTFEPPVNMKSKITVGALQSVTNVTCAPATAAACRDQIVNYMVGVPSATPVTRCKAGGDCNVMGDIFHSVPQVRNGIPSDFLRDPTYSAFSASLMTRDTMVYTSTNDGFFHGFWLVPGDKDPNRLVSTKIQNEEWAFIPPAVLPSFATMYPTQTASSAVNLTHPPVNRVPALDGVPVIRDVGATQGGTRALNSTAGSPTYYPYRLERKRFPASNETHTWRTIMTQAFGPLRGGYFAMDLTTPTIVANDYATGPKFLWQLTTDDAGHPIFGKGSPTPLITTLFVDLSNLGLGSASEQTLEVPVAVLPGGTGDAPSSNVAACSNSGPQTPIDPVSSGPTTGNARATKVHCYDSASSIGARSLTIVRLDTGQVLRTFRPNLPTGLTTPVTFDSKVLTLQDIPAPIIGQPAAFPSQPGQIADRIFVGDVEGRIWRIDVSKPDPAQWTMSVFFDAYWDLSGTVKPQPVQTAPVLSVDDKGQITVAFSTGDQDNLTPDSTQTNYVVSVTESVLTDLAGTRQFNSKLNWRQPLTNGERVLGPMALFDNALYYTTYPHPSASGGTGPLGACEKGDSYLNGANYRIAAGSGTPATSGGAPVPGFTPQTYLASVVSGVALRQQPSCAPGAVTGASTDDFLGYGKTTTVTSINPGKFELVVQKSGGTAVTGASPIPTQATQVATPRLPVRIDSWAPIIE